MKCSLDYTLFYTIVVHPSSTNSLCKIMKILLRCLKFIKFWHCITNEASNWNNPPIDKENEVTLITNQLCNENKRYTKMACSRCTWLTWIFCTCIENNKFYLSFKAYYLCKRMLIWSLIHKKSFNYKKNILLREVVEWYSSSLNLHSC